jgi:hypothetical protein
MKTVRIASLIAIAGFLEIAASTGIAAGQTPPLFRGFATNSTAALSPSGAAIGVTLKGVKRLAYVLVVHGTLTAVGAGEVELTPFVNGVQMQPGQAAEDCPGACTLSGTWYLVMSDAYTSNNAAFFDTQGKALPLDIELEGGSNIPVTGALSLTAELQHK